MCCCSLFVLGTDGWRFFMVRDHEFNHLYQKKVIQICCRHDTTDFLFLLFIITPILLHITYIFGILNIMRTRRTF